jgi:hypothetical protein
VTLVLVPVLSAGPLAAAGRTGWARWSWAAGTASAACLLASAAGPAHGFWPRAGLLAGDLWIVIRAVDVCRTTSPTAPVPSR